ncbi:MAG: class I SAM-dependent methyltransferase [Deltaproteobacteria bacterium]|nr:class I SAM-dependent methyltransferase [Deltaproteobacteria bacterium]
MRYTYGTSEAAANRLEEIAKFFNPLALQFIRHYLSDPTSSALDLGCGPGFTTDMLSRSTGCPNVYGIDKSADFLKLATARFKHCTFIEHDVTKTPFPVRADVMYLRFLFSHLKNVVELINRWIGEVQDSGILFIEELEDVTTEVKVFQKYLKINADLIASQGANLYVGTTLSKGRYNADVICNEYVTIQVANFTAATWFLPNTLTIWRKEQYILDRVTQAEREEISTAISQIKESGDAREGSTWKIRRLVLKRK